MSTRCYIPIRCQYWNEKRGCIAPWEKIDHNPCERHELDIIQHERRGALNKLWETYKILREYG